MNAVYGSPFGLLLDVWLALPDVPWWVPAVVVFLVRLGMDVRAWARWPHGKP